MKARVVILLFIVLLFGKTSVSQITEIYSDTLTYAPYEFSVNKTKFRFKLNKGDYLVLIQKFNLTWVATDTISLFQKISLKDINKDGYLDIGFYQKWVTDVWIFNPKTNLFIPSGEYPSMEFSDDEKHMVLLDSKLQIYYNYSWYKRGEWGSELFMLKKYKKITLGTIQNHVLFSSKKGDYVTKAIVINKLSKGNEQKVKEIPWHNKKFNYTSYWKQNWRKFLPK